MNDRRDIEDAARALGVELLPWQRQVGQRILDGEQIMVVRGRRPGWWTLARVVDHAAHPAEPRCDAYARLFPSAALTRPAVEFEGCCFVDVPATPEGDAFRDDLLARHTDHGNTDGSRA